MCTVCSGPLCKCYTARANLNIQCLKLWREISAEPAGTVAYSCDLQMRVVWQRIGMGLSFRTIASNLNVSVDRNSSM